MAKAKSVQLHQLRTRQGEGVRLVVTERRKEADGETLTLDMLQAPVPDRRYVADAAAVVEGLAGYRIVFAQTKFVRGGDGPELRSMIDIQMPTRGTEQFLASLGSIRDKLNQAGALPLLSDFNEPTQTAGLSANLAPIAFTGHECCVDFYQLSPFATTKMQAGGDIYAEPVVRVILPTGLLVGVVRQLETLLSAHQSP